MIGLEETKQKHWVTCQQVKPFTLQLFPPSTLSPWRVKQESSIMMWSLNKSKETNKHSAEANWVTWCVHWLQDDWRRQKQQETKAAEGERRLHLFCSHLLLTHCWSDFNSDLMLLLLKDYYCIKSTFKDTLMGKLYFTKQFAFNKNPQLLSSYEGNNIRKYLSYDGTVCM